MEHQKAETRAWEEQHQHFTGTARFSPMSKVEGGLYVLGVAFDPGVRTDWHRHAEGQTLYIAAGAGRVGTEDGEMVQVGPGDVVVAPPGELHWHGAAPASPMVHLSLTTGPPTEWVGGPVSDDEYAGGAKGSQS